MAVGVFGLQVAYKLKRTELLSLDDTHGWFDAASRIDFSNDSIAAVFRGGGLSSSRSKFTSTGNSNYGWFGGGFTGSDNFPNPQSLVDRLDFSNDSAVALSRGNIILARRNLSATSNFNFGWFGGGYTTLTPNGPQSRIDRIDFSNDTTSSPRGPLSLGRENLAATGNSNYGWFGGGARWTPAPLPPAIAYSTVDRIDFANDSATASPRGPLSGSSYSAWAATGNSNYGWFGGGYSSFVTRIDYVNDSATSLTRGPLTASRGYLGVSATGNSNYGWFAGGVTPVDRIDFSNDLAAASVRGTYGPSTTTATSGRATGASIKLQKTGNFGWFGGGSAPSGSTTAVDRIDFSNDSVIASARSGLSLAKDFLSATGNSNYGWFGGGTQTPGSISEVTRIDFSNDLSIASQRSPLSLVRSSLAATGNSNYGWFGGGNPGTLSRVDRIDFFNDLTRPMNRGPLNSSRYFLAATGNSNYGWFGGGSPGPLSTVDRIDFSNDFATALLRGPLSLARRILTSTGNSNYGWFGGGYSAITTVDRINFSNDSINASPRGALDFGRAGIAAAANSNYGWFGGGSSPGRTSRVNRIDFSNDSATSSPRGPLSLDKTFSSALSNAPIG